MDRTWKFACFWPGLPQLWFRGAWFGLALALGFTALVNTLLAATLVWDQWLSPGLVRIGWGVLAVLWGSSAWVSLRKPPVRAPAAPSSVAGTTEPDLFPQVQRHFLQQNWYEAETLLSRMCSQNEQDADARLMLASVKRHQGLLDQAEEELGRLEAMIGAPKWRWEVYCERQLIARSREASQGAPLTEGMSTSHDAEDPYESPVAEEIISSPPNVPEAA